MKPNNMSKREIKSTLLSMHNGAMKYLKKYLIM